MNELKHISVQDLSVERQIQLKAIIQMATAVSRCCSQAIAVYDVLHRCFVCVSENFGVLTKSSADMVMSMGLAWFDEVFDESSVACLKRMSEEILDIIANGGADEVKEYSASCVLRMKSMNRALFYVTTPISVDGDAWYQLCVLSVSNKNEWGLPTLRGNPNKEKILIMAHKEASFMSEIDRRIVLLSGRGLSQEKIAQMLCLSVDTIKAHKRVLYKKYGVKSMNELLVMMFNVGGQIVSKKDGY